MKAMRGVVVLAVVAALAYGAYMMMRDKSSPSGPSAQTPAAQNDAARPGKPEEKPRVEQKYGFTSEGVGGG
jgi:hypothetical protein